MSIHVDVVSAEGEIFSDAASMLFVAAEEGELGILQGHAPLLTRIRPGQVKVRKDGEDDHQFFVSGGILEVQPHLVTVLADTAERATDIDAAEAERAKERAETAVADAKDRVDMARAQNELAEAAARLEMVQKLRTGR